MMRIKIVGAVPAGTNPSGLDLRVFKCRCSPKGARGPPAHYTRKSKIHAQEEILSFFLVLHLAFAVPALPPYREGFSGGFPSSIVKYNHLGSPI